MPFGDVRSFEGCGANGPKFSPNDMEPLRLPSYVANMNDAERVLRAGAALLDAKLKPLGFSFVVTSRGSSSGGNFAEGYFGSGDRELWLSYRHSLGLVRYRKAKVELSHEQYMRALHLRSVARYPGFSNDPMAAFVDLLADLDHCDSFLLDDGNAFEKLALSYIDPPKGFTRLGHE